jgi:RimJ/RimL family protein N-acetyltransferase
MTTAPLLHGDASEPRPAAPGPTIRTERLVLRPYRPADVEALAAFLATDRAAFMGGPFTPATAWFKFAVELAQWPLHGHGGLAVTLPDGTLVGRVVVQRRPDYPEPEMGWIALDGHEGRGLMTEAAAALRDWVRAHCALPSLVSYVERGNHRSVALAERLGARLDPAAAPPGPGIDVHRHWGADHARPDPSEGAGADHGRRRHAGGRVREEGRDPGARSEGGTGAARAGVQP